MELFSLIILLLLSTVYYVSLTRFGHHSDSSLALVLIGMPCTLQPQTSVYRLASADKGFLAMMIWLSCLHSHFRDWGIAVVVIPVAFILLLVVPLR